MSQNGLTDSQIEQMALTISANRKQVEQTIELLDAGNTVPFIARYRKEMTGGLDDNQLRLLAEKLVYVRELNERRETILNAIAEQDKLSPTLKQSILEADSKTRLEDLYLPYKKKRRTKAQMAREAGLEPLLEQLIQQPTTSPELLAKAFINQDKAVNSEEDALEGARQIAMENLAEDADLVQLLRDWLQQTAVIISKLPKTKEKDPKAERFKDYFDFQEPIKNIPSHRMLALLRGQKEGYLQVSIDHPSVLDETQETHPALGRMIDFTGWPAKNSDWLMRTIEMAWKVKLHLKLSLQLTSELRHQADEAAIEIFGRNLRDLLLAAPAGNHVTMGLDPAYRTGVKVVVIDNNGQLIDKAVVYPHKPQQQWDQALLTLTKMCQKHQVSLIAIGNGTASRETDQLAAELLTNKNIKAQKLMISEAGASVYSASESAAREFPDLDVSYRGAVSIARRLQDPLAELVKIDPKAIGVGQYQHDVNQSRLNKALQACVEDCVNAVGVDLNTASPDILKYVAGISDSVAQNIIDFRTERGGFSDRKQLLEVPRLGEKMFEQSAGFLRIRGGKQPLDQSAVHPEAYPLVEQILTQIKQPIEQVMGQVGVLKNIDAQDFANDQFGLATIKDVLAELQKPGRDPRGEFKTATFDDKVHTMTDLESGMRLEGVVTNVTAFGAFVDIGVHQDGLVHISELADQFVKDPSDVVKAGDIIKVRVLDVDVQRKRIALSAKSEQAPSQVSAKKDSAKPVRKSARKKSAQGNKRPQSRSDNAFSGAMADAFKKARK
ncbi:Tex family protein [Marinicella gelatinilytica]|uniref:Tex family protein n=1 Tax=Marinicella gelatinilytica TaxID=2996017 RepID=UPI002260CAA4|nr:Tex family protein [Marinicella gelatinilytica]MCX7544434.1 Tex family protein [Marinicella gelatinilytica]